VARPQVAAKPVAAGLAAVLAIAGVVIAKWEGVRYQAYPDPATGGAPWTVCFGHTGPDVVRGRQYTRAECEALLRQDMLVANSHVRRCVGRTMPTGVEAALTSLTFNVGPVAVCRKTIGHHARNGDWPATCAELDKWKYAGGRVYRGLVLRRADERAVCEGRA
jgi:lysozyme